MDAQFVATDNNGAETVEWLNRTLTNSAPGLNLKKPGNTTYWRYGHGLEFTVSNNDSIPGEQHTCEIRKDGQLQSTVSVGNEETFTNNSFRSDLGQHNVEVSCTDPSGNTETKNVSYQVKAFELNSVSADSPVYETRNETFSASMKTGEMVEDVETRLIWNGSEKDSRATSPSGISTFSELLSHEIPLVENNQTNTSWKTSGVINYTGFNGGYTTQTVESSIQFQEVRHGFYLVDNYTDPGSGRYIEKEDLRHYAVIRKETQKAQITGVTEYLRNNEVDVMEETSSSPTFSTFRGTIDTGRADSFNQSTFEALSRVTILFNGRFRQIVTPESDIEVYRILLTDGSSGLNTAKALSFDTDYEEEGYDVNTDLRMDISVFKNRNEITRRYSFISEDTQNHDFYIYPAWAQYQIRTLNYPEGDEFDIMQYEKTDDLGVLRSYFFPRPETIDNTTTTVPLITINRSETTRIDFELTDQNGDAAQQVTCRVDRKFPGQGKHETVFMIKTGAQGRSQSFAEVNEIYYRITCYDNGEVIDTFPDQIMDDPMRLQLGAGDTKTNLDYNQQFDASCSYNVTRISCTYQSRTDELEEAVLSVYTKEPYQDQFVNSSTATSATGGLSISGLNTTKENYRFEVLGNYPNNIRVTGVAGVIGDQSLKYGAIGLIITIISFLFVYAATSFNVLAGIGIGTLVLVIYSALDFVVLNPVQRASLLALVIVIAVVISK